MAKGIGAEQARQRLPQLLDRASRGQTTIITKHGKPCAAIVPVASARASSRAVGLVALMGSGKGLWGDPTRYVREARDEWE